MTDPEPRRAGSLDCKHIVNIEDKYWLARRRRAVEALEPASAALPSRARAEKEHLCHIFCDVLHFRAPSLPRGRDPPRRTRCNGLMKDTVAQYCERLIGRGKWRCEEFNGTRFGKKVVRKIHLLQVQD